MNSPHLGKGSKCPPLKEGVIRIYTMRFCPYAQRAVLVALAKDIPHEIVNCNLTDKAEWLFEKNPQGKVPIIELQNGKILYESLITAEYFDEAYKNRPLRSSDEFQRGVDRIMIEEFNKVTSMFYKMLGDIKQKDNDALKEHLNDFQKTLMPFEKELEKRGTTFFGGNNEPGYLDYMIWPWIERVPVIKLAVPEGLFDFEIAKKKNPSLEAWRKGMKNDATIQKIIATPEVHKQFIDGFLAGSPNYDLLNA